MVRARLCPLRSYIGKEADGVCVMILLGEQICNVAVQATALGLHYQIPGKSCAPMWRLSSDAPEFIAYVGVVLFLLRSLAIDIAAISVRTVNTISKTISL
jgi:hypothetical protein